MTKNCTHWAVSRRHLFHALGPAILLITSTLLPTSADAQGHLKTSAPSQHLKKRHHKEAVKTTVPAPAIEPVVDLPPPVPLTPEQMPPRKPEVSWDGQQLTIISANSTLADILAEVRRLTGASLDVPPNAAHERVAAQLGPGLARDVLSTLLAGTNFDYVIQASETDPAAIRSVFLTARGKTDTTGARGNTPIVADVSGRPFRGTRRMNVSTEDSTPNETAVVRPDGQPEASPPSQPETSSPQSAASVPGAALADANSQSADAQPPSPDLSASIPNSGASQAPLSEAAQRVQQMQSLFEQRKQMMEDAHKPPAN